MPRLKRALICSAPRSTPRRNISGRGRQRALGYFFFGRDRLPNADCKLRYGAEVAKSRTKAAQRKLRYQSLLDTRDREMPAWVDATLRKAVQPDPYKRYEELSEFTYDLRHPNGVLMNEKGPPLLERNPLIFWKCVCFILSVVIAVLVFK